MATGNRARLGGDPIAFARGHRDTALVRWAPNTRFNAHSHPGGEEIPVLDGSPVDLGHAKKADQIAPIELRPGWLGQARRRLNFLLPIPVVDDDSRPLGN